jgi:hypothetical protein
MGNVNCCACIDQGQVGFVEQVRHRQLRVATVAAVAACYLR